MIAAWIGATALSFAIGYRSGRHIERRTIAALPVATLPHALAEHVATFREIVRATDGAISPELEESIGRMLATTTARSKISPDEAWRAFVSDFGPAKSWTEGMSVLKQWAPRIDWNADRRRWVLSFCRAADNETERIMCRKVIDAVWLE